MENGGDSVSSLEGKAGVLTLGAGVVWGPGAPTNPSGAEVGDSKATLWKEASGRYGAAGCGS
jgi:hypothetical protein